MTLLVEIKDQFTQSLEKFCMFVSNLIENASKKDRGGEEVEIHNKEYIFKEVYDI